MNKAQKKQFEILCEVDKLCRKHNLKYFLTGGTLLGAIRHKGFIPWDDDVDIVMLREDYDKFKKIALKEMDKKYFYQDVDTDKYYGNMFAKIRINNTKYIEDIAVNNKSHNGIYLDIFPLDYYNNNSLFDYKKILVYRMLLLIKCNYIIKANTFFKKISLIILKIMSIFYTRKRIINKINKLIKKNNQKCDKVIECNTPYFNKCLFPSKHYEDVVEYKFENKKFYGTKYYDEYLSYLYGDYMKLPPVEKRRSHGIIEVSYDE